MRISDLLAGDSDPQSLHPIGQRDRWAVAEGGGEVRGKPNPKTLSPWPQVTLLHLFIQHQIPAGLYKCPRVQTVRADTCSHRLTHADRQTQFVAGDVLHYIILFVHHPCIFSKDWTWPWSERNWIMSGKSCDILMTSNAVTCCIAIRYSGKTG